jgi:AraC family transcriptional regulator
MVDNIARESLTLHDAIPGGRILVCSLDAGWSSLLVRKFESPANVEAFETSTSPDQLVVLMVKGECRTQSFSNGAWRSGHYRPGIGGLTAGGRTGRLRWRSKHKMMETVRILIPQQTIAATIDEFRLAGSSYRTEPLDALVFNDPTIVRLGFALLDAVRLGAPNLYAQSASQFLATHLLSLQSGWLRPHNDDRHPGIISDRRVTRVLEYMEAKYMEPVSLDELAREAGVSRFHFVQVFQKQVGVTPYRHIVRLRMRAAAEKLAESDMSVLEVALSCGYQNAGHFTSSFRRYFSETPIEYRSRARAI